MLGGNVDGLWCAPPPGLCVLGDTHMARVLALDGKSVLTIGGEQHSDSVIQ